MPRDIERAPDGTRSVPSKASHRPKEALQEPDRRLTRPPLGMKASCTDPELLSYRRRLDQQLAARRDSMSGAALAFGATAPAQSFRWQSLLVWTAPLAVFGAAAFAGWWIASAPMAGVGEEAAQFRQVRQEEPYKAQNVSVAVAGPADRAPRQRERDILQNALKQSESERTHLAHSARENGVRDLELARQPPAPPEALPGSTIRPNPRRQRDDSSGEKVDPELARLLSRATQLVAQGDIAGARVVLERAAETGSAAAMFALAETFDPAILSAWGTVGTQGDPAGARELYARALAGGIAAARARMAALEQ